MKRREIINEFEILLEILRDESYHNSASDLEPFIKRLKDGEKIEEA